MHVWRAGLCDAVLLLSALYLSDILYRRSMSADRASPLLYGVGSGSRPG